MSCFQMSAQPANPAMMETEEMGDNHIEPLTIKRVIHISIYGTLSNFGLDGVQSAQWKPLDGKIVDVLGPSEHENPHSNVNSTLSSLSNAVIKKAVILEQQNNFPVPLGMSISCLHNEEVTENGEKYVCTMLPRTKCSTPQLLYEADKMNTDSLKWSQQYPGFNANNLEVHEVMDVANAVYMFVRETHPVISLLRANTELLGMAIDDQPKIDNEWYKVNKTVFATCCQTLKKKILPRLNTRDLTKFSVQLHRLNGEEWADLNGSEEPMQIKANHNWSHDEFAKAKAAAYKHTAMQTYGYLGRLELTYEIQP